MLDYIDQEEQTRRNIRLQKWMGACCVLVLTNAFTLWWLLRLLIGGCK